tara:strand:+ start:2917 stop:4221 length:1305 start_codon:yes stop_codon:yes gene_type:complete
MNLKNKARKINGLILLKNGEIYDSFANNSMASDILIDNGIIVNIQKNISSTKNCKVINCKNKIITNGFIDLHTHFRDPGFEIKETIISGSWSAFYGGYTRVCTMPNTSPVIDNPELIKYTINKSKDTCIYIHPIGAITKKQMGKELAEIGSMVAEGAVAISDDGLPVSNSQVLRMALEYSKMYNIPVINHAEDLSLVNNGLINESDNSIRLGLPGNPGIAESSMVFRDLSIAEYVGGKIHVPHVSSKKSIDVIKSFKSKGINVSSEVTPHHLCLDDSILERYDTNAKVAPPIRSSIDQKALLSAVIDGTIDCIATDHAPHTIEDKEKDFENASCGMIGLESAFGLVNKTLYKSKVPMKSIINLFTVNPAKIFNISTNLIEEGNMAEINVIDPNVDWTFSVNDIMSKSKNSPIIGERLKGRVLVTINKGYILDRI